MKKKSIDNIFGYGYLSGVVGGILIGDGLGRIYSKGISFAEYAFKPTAEILEKTQYNFLEMFIGGSLIIAPILFYLIKNQIRSSNQFLIEKLLEN